MKLASNLVEKSLTELIEDRNRLADVAMKALRIAVTGLGHSAGGCLVPPDGGSPTVQDHIDNAKNTLNEIQKMLNEAGIKP